MTTNKAVFSRDTASNKITVARTFDAPLDQVWKAWTDSTILDQWWAPKPYRAETKEMDFRVGGHWLYCMVGPSGDRSCCKETFRTIEPQRRITNVVCFCDEAGNENRDFPLMYWKKEFTSNGDTTDVHIEITFDRSEDMEKIIGMGFEGGFTMGMNNLDAYLEESSNG